MTGYAKARTLLRRELAGAAAALLALGLPAQASAQAGAWQVVDAGHGYSVAKLTGTGGGFNSIGLLCDKDKPTIALNLARAPLRTPALMTFVSGAARVDFGVVRNGQTNVWAAYVQDPRILDLVAGGQTMTVAVDGVSYGTASLAGAAAALRTALAGCWRGPANVAQADADRASMTPGAQSQGDIPLGTYAMQGPDGVTCGQLDWEWHYGYSPDGYDATIFVDDQLNPDLSAALKPKSENTVTLQWDRADKPVTYKFCPPEQLKLDARFFLKKDRKIGRQLPIKPGYYRAIDTETGKPLACKDYAVCSYFLFEPTRYALRGTDYDINGKLTGYSNVVRKFTSVAQVGARTYEAGVAGDDSGGGEPFLVEGPDKFRSWNGEAGIWKFVPVDPKTIPANQMPHF